MQTLYIKRVWQDKCAVRDEHGNSIPGWSGLWPIEYLQLYAKANGVLLVILPESEPIVEVR